MRLWRDHGTKLLGTASTILPGLIAIDGLLPGPKKYWLGLGVVLGAFTIQRGFTNSQNLKT